MNIDITEINGISNLHNHRKWFHKRLNKLRWGRYKQREQLFGLDSTDMPFGESPLPEADKWKIATQNAESWKNAIQEFFLDTTAKLENKRTAIEADQFPSCVEEKRIRLSDFTVDGENIYSDTLTVCLSEPAKSFESEETIIIDYKNNTIDTINQKPRARVGNPDLQKLISKSVSTGAIEKTPISVRKTNNEFPVFFENIDVGYEKVGSSTNFSTYIIWNKDRNGELISEFVSKLPVPLSTYCNFFGFPIFLTRFRNPTKVDAISSEEFAVYLYKNGTFDKSDLESFLLCPYTPPPDKRHAKLSSQLGEQIRLGATHDNENNQLVQDSINHEIENIPTNNAPFDAPLSSIPVR